MLRIISPLLISSFLLAGCSFKGCSENSSPTAEKTSQFYTPDNSEKKAKVGDFVITDQMIKDRDQLIRVSFPNEKRSMGLHQLKQAYTDLQILINNGYVMNKDLVEKERVRIDENTQAPEKLRQVKNIFGKRYADYLNVFILPTYARRVIYYEFFLHNEEIQSESRALAEDFLKQVKTKPEAWDVLAASPEVIQAKAKVSLENGFEFIREDEHRPDEDKPGIVDQSPTAADGEKVKEALAKQQKKVVSEAGRRWIDELIKTTEPGQVIDKIINAGEAGWQVVRYVGANPKAKDTYDLQVAIFRKRDYGLWHAQESAKVKVETY